MKLIMTESATGSLLVADLPAVGLNLFQHKKQAA
jgi:hypothetical protein